MASTFVLRGIEEEGGIPVGSHVLVVALPKSTRAWEGEAEAEEIPMALDPGKYAYVVSKMRDDPAPSGSQATEIQYNGEFYHDCAPKDFDVLQRLQPQAARFRNTSDGGKWFCQMGWGCKYKAGTPLAMVIHECEKHLGITKDDLLASKKAQLSYKQKAIAAMEQRKADENKRLGKSAAAK